MIATKRKPAAKAARIPPKVQKALSETDPKTREFILETIRLKEAGLLSALK